MIDRQDLHDAPDFERTDAGGNGVSLSDYRGRKNVLLVFNRGFT